VTGAGYEYQHGEYQQQALASAQPSAKAASTTEQVTKRRIEFSFVAVIR